MFSSIVWMSWTIFTHSCIWVYNKKIIFTSIGWTFWVTIRTLFITRTTTCSLFLMINYFFSTVELLFALFVSFNVTLIVSLVTLLFSLLIFNDIPTIILLRIIISHPISSNLFNSSFFFLLEDFLLSIYLFNWIFS